MDPAHRPSPRTLHRKTTLRHTDLLSLSGEVGPCGVGETAVGRPERHVLLDATEVPIPGVDVPVATRLARSYGRPIVSRSCEGGDGRLPDTAGTPFAGAVRQGPSPQRPWGVQQGRS